MRRCLFPVLALFALAVPLAGCDGNSRDGAMEVAMIAAPDDLYSKGVRLDEPAQILRAATVDGLVRRDASGEVVPALAERWIVTDDGRSYIFRLRDGVWPDGTKITGQNARDALRRAIRALRGTSLGQDLSAVDEVRAMAGRVVEIRLTSPMPDFLQLLAQPELGLFHRGKGMGLMALVRADEAADGILRPVPPQARGGVEDPDWEARVREIHLQALSAEQAVELFDNGALDIVLNGRIEDLPRVDTGPLSRGTVRLENVVGLMGLTVQSAKGAMAEPALREAVAMAIDRDALIDPFNLGGWEPTTRLVAPGLPGDLGTIGERWTSLDISQRQSESALRVARWRKAHVGIEALLKIWMPGGPGADMMMKQLKRDLEAGGFAVKRVEKAADADLVWTDRVARFVAPEWFLNQFHCSLRRRACSPEADALVAEARKATDDTAEAALIAEAEAELTKANVFIPVGAPLRWSLVRGNITGFEPNGWAFHPLPPLVMPTT
ncbi:MAG: ABC transporter substrate-binding protein [Novosphingobium sp.]|nr:ABC transporter substrate-binding protein [Novosphingobium sp.]